jgi:hypothetical protein
LTEEIKPSDFTHTLIKHTHVTALHCLGYLLENACFNTALVYTLCEAMKKEDLILFHHTLIVAYCDNIEIFMPKTSV